jgi:hypothetical protein
MVPPVDAYHYDLFPPHMLTSVPGPPPLPSREPGTAGPPVRDEKWVYRLFRAGLFGPDDVPDLGPLPDFPCDPQRIKAVKHPRGRARSHIVPISRPKAIGGNSILSKRPINIGSEQIDCGRALLVAAGNRCARGKAKPQRQSLTSLTSPRGYLMRAPGVERSPSAPDYLESIEKLPARPAVVNQGRGQNRELLAALQEAHRIQPTAYFLFDEQPGVVLDRFAMMEDGHCHRQLVRSGETIRGVARIAPSRFRRRRQGAIELGLVR